MFLNISSLSSQNLSQSSCAAACVIICTSLCHYQSCRYDTSHYMSVHSTHVTKETERVPTVYRAATTCSQLLTVWHAGNEQVPNPMSQAHLHEARND